ncbi:MAG TPA: flavodoxin family protein [Clostridiales bacterium]|nr:flavodoxin family protein [Clostridiales bacterium]
MKVLGVSFGRKNKNCDILVKQALFAAKEAGAEVKFINTMNMKISHCTGCGACSKLRDQGKQIKCVTIKDDYLELENEFLNADGIIIAAPVYSIAPTGQFKNYIDRFGAAHDRAAALAEQEKRIKAGAEELLDPRVLADKYVAYISVGGAKTQDWVSLGLPNMYMFGMSTVMKAVGQIDAYNMGTIVNPVLEDELMEKTAKLGEHLAKSIGKPYDQVEWMGEEGVCPVCHNSMITLGKTTDVQCPMCGIHGKLSIENGEVKVTFSEKEQKRARNTLEGLTEHYQEIQGFVKNFMPKFEKNKDKIEEGMKRIGSFESTY